MAPHGFFTRRGGVSSGPFASLNCSLSGQDDRDAVLENRARAARSLRADPSHLLGLTQVHGTAVVTVTEPWAPGQGKGRMPWSPTAPGSGAGYRHGRLCAGAVRRSRAEHRWRRPCRLARRGHGRPGGHHHRNDRAGRHDRSHRRRHRPLHRARPPIEVGARPTRRCPGSIGSRRGFFHTRGSEIRRWQFDLPGYCAARLRAAGVRQVVVTGVDTLVDEDRFFSHRRRTLADRQARYAGRPATNAGPIGHQISVIRPA